VISCAVFDYEHETIFCRKCGDYVYDAVLEVEVRKSCEVANGLEGVSVSMSASVLWRLHMGVCASMHLRA